MSRKLIVANWKMHGNQQQIAAMIQAMRADETVLQQVEVSLCVPFVYLSSMAALCTGINLSYGAQNISEKHNGAFTGEICAAMLADIGCKYVIVGHSERRQYYGESNEVVAQKWLAARHARLTPILCLGESAEQRQSGQTLSIVTQQLDAILSQTTTNEFAHTVIAYEPVWAIGTGLTPTADEVTTVHTVLRQHLIKQYDSALADSVRILYGGSVKSDNAELLLNLKNVDGGLIGGASLQYDSFSPIYKKVT
jgi:triosephosphate isomerase